MTYAPTLLRRFLVGLRGLVSVSPLILSLVSTAFVWIASRGALLSAPLIYPVVVVVVWMLANYFFEVVDHRARGESDWPVASMETLSTARRQSGIYFAALMIAIVVVEFSFAASGWVQTAEILGGLVVCALPASAALLAVTKHPLKCINPNALLATAVGLGGSYLVLVAALGGVAWLVRFAYLDRGFLTILAATYGYLLLAYLLGSRVYTRRSVLGVRTPRSPEARADAAFRELLKERESALGHAYAFAGRDNVAGALEHLQRYADSEADPTAARLWLFNQMLHWEHRRPVLEFGESLMAELETAGRDREAAKVRATCAYLLEPKAVD